MHSFFSGLMIATGLIAAIGAQNTFVLKQGLLKQHIGLVVLICCLCDALLMGGGIWGIGTLLAGSPLLSGLLALSGGLFLLAYGLRCLHSVWQGNSHIQPENLTGNNGICKTVLTTLTLTLLNPHVYIDTVVLIGGMAAPFPPSEKQAFWFGTVCASLIWFTALGYGARLLLPLFARPRTWQILDSLIAVMMFYLAYSLLRQSWFLLTV
ncbi:MAG: LysE family transporter [Neisseria sp.]|nr:LysE family transporter [Neisseria sp.]